MERDFYTASTKTRLENLEEKRSLLSEKILLEQCKEKQILTKEEIVKHISRLCAKVQNNSLTYW